MVAEIKVPGLFIVKVYFVFLGNVETVVVIDALNVVYQKCLELEGAEVQLGHSVVAEQINMSVLVAGDARDGVAEETVRVVFLQFIGLYIRSVVSVQAFPGANPKHTVLIYVKAVDREL